MQTLGLIEPVMLIVAGFSRYPELLAESEQTLQQAFGPLVLTGPTLDFRFTDYYEASMGAGLLKRFWAFDRLQAPDLLAAVKRRTIEMEQEIIVANRYPETRPLNLDPGFLGLGKFVLATTKDQSHRIYLHGGIFAEVTLRYHDGAFEPRPWTYVDWQQPQVLTFLQKARREFVKRRSGTGLTELPPLLIPTQNEL